MQKWLHHRRMLPHWDFNVMASRKQSGHDLPWTSKKESWLFEDPHFDVIPSAYKLPNHPTRNDGARIIAKRQEVLILCVNVEVPKIGGEIVHLCNTTGKRTSSVSKLESRLPKASSYKLGFADQYPKSKLWCHRKHCILTNMFASLFTGRNSRKKPWSKSEEDELTLLLWLEGLYKGGATK